MTAPGNPSRARIRPDRIGATLGLSAGELARVLLLESAEAVGREACTALPADGLRGEPERRAAGLARIERLLAEALGDARVAAHWVRRRNAHLCDETPLAWMAGPTRQIEQLEMRLERERRDRRRRPS